MAGPSIVGLKLKSPNNPNLINAKRLKEISAFFYVNQMNLKQGFYENAFRESKSFFMS